MPNSINDLVYTVTDNGSFVIPQTDLARYPKGSYVGISISRAWLDNTTGTIAYVAITEAHTVPLLVIEPTPSNITINGPSSICTSADFGVNNLPLGFSVSWSASPSGQVQLSCTNCQQTTATKYSYASPGTVIITAIITNGYSSDTLHKSIQVESNANIAGTYNSPTNSNEIMVPNGRFDLTTFNAACVAFQTNLSAPSGSSVSWSGSADPGVTWYQGGKDVFCNFTAIGQIALLSVNITNSCGTSTATYRFKCTTTTTCGITPLVIESESQISFSPNPTNNILKVSFKESLYKFEKRRIYQINVFDKLGNKMLFHNYNQGSNTANLDVSFLRPDVYLIKVFDGQAWYSEKFIKN